MDHYANSIGDVPHTPVTFQVRIDPSGTNSEEKTPKSTKRARRRLGEDERKIVAAKRGKVCQTCHERKVKCDHAFVFRDEVSTLPTPHESNTRLQAALGIKDANRPIQTKDKRCTVFAPRDVAQTPSNNHSLKRKGPFSGSGMSEKRRKAPLEPENQSGSRVKRATDSSWNSAQDGFHLIQTDNIVSAGTMTSIGSPQAYPSTELRIGDAIPWDWEAMPLLPMPAFESNSVSRSCSVGNAAEGHFNLQFAPSPQPFSADQRGYDAFGLLQGLESVASLEEESTQHLAPSGSEVKLTTQAPEQGGMYAGHQEARYSLHDFNDANFHTPSNHPETPSLDFRLSTVESQGQTTATPHGLTDTPSRKTTGGQQGLDILCGEESTSAADWLQISDEIGDSGKYESWIDYLTRDR